MSKKVFVYVSVIFLSVHFIFILLIQCYQQNWSLFKTKSIEKINSAYVTPYFEQNWAMFAPNPPQGNQFIAVQFYTEKDSTEIVNIHQKVLESSFHNVFSINQRILKYFNGCYNNIITKKTSDISSNELVKRSHGLQSIVNYSKIVLGNQEKFIEKSKSNDSIYLDVYLVNEPLNNLNFSKQLNTKTYIDISKIYIGTKKDLQR